MKDMLEMINATNKQNSKLFALFYFIFFRVDAIRTGL